MNTSDIIRLYLIDDHLMVLEGLKSLFSNVSDIQVCGTCTNAEDAYDEVKVLKPDVILMDIRLPGMSGIEACKLIKDSLPDIKVIILTSFLEPRMVSEAMESGADGYLLKQIDSQQLYSSVRQVIQGEMAITPSATKELISSMKNKSIEDSDADVFSCLSSRDIQIAKAVALGKINKEIADELDLNEKTIKNLLTSIFGKLEINRRSQLAVLYEKYSKAQEDLK
ncbi:MAG: response regulator transcription factor [Verrucomicrobiota bacterium]